MNSLNGWSPCPKCGFNVPGGDHVCLNIENSLVSKVEKLSDLLYAMLDNKEDRQMWKPIEVHTNEYGEDEDQNGDLIEGDWTYLLTPFAQSYYWRNYTRIYKAALSAGVEDSLIIDILDEPGQPFEER